MTKRPDRGRPAAGLGRRELLQLGAGSLAAAVGAASSRPVSAQAPAAPAPGFVPPAPPSAAGIGSPEGLMAETWLEPWVWRPSEWPDQTLDLNVVENQNPGLAPSPGNRFPTLFSFNGTSPAPTIRMRGDEKLSIKLRNLLGMNHGGGVLGAAPDPLDLPPTLARTVAELISKKSGVPMIEQPPYIPVPVLLEHFDTVFEHCGVTLHPTACMAEAANVAHGARVTNVHMHGLHVEPLRNADGTYADNVFVRVIPRADWKMRQAAPDPKCRVKGDDECIGEADYVYSLGDVLKQQRQRDGLQSMPQPPGTHWYHPHSHGSTHDQVSSGMAGFLILEGDVDDAINKVMTGTERPDPEEKTGPYDYRERLVLIQRVEVQSVDSERPRRRDQVRLPPPTAVNGTFPPTTMFMRPGAVERWRIVNGSVDGRGFKRVMVLEGQFVQDFRSGQIWRVKHTGEGDATERELEPVTLQQIEDAKQTIYQLSSDGMTLVTVENGRAKYTIRDLSKQNAGTANPLSRPFGAGEQPWRAMLRNVEDCFRDGESIRNAFVRPNEVYLGNANRADLFFKAPAGAKGKVFTLFAQEALLHTDNFQQRLQQSVARDIDRGNPAPMDVPVAWIHVRGDHVEGGDFDVMSLRDVLPAVPPFLQPIGEDELRVPAAEARHRGVPTGSHRSRVISYSGYGGADFPLVHVPAEWAAAHPELENRIWAREGDHILLLAPAARTMATNSDFDLAKHPAPPAPRKFAHHDHDGEIRVHVDTAEEWVLYNSSLMLWGNGHRPHRDPGGYGAHAIGHPISRAEGQARFAKDPGYQILAKGIDHPFHIHINPMWVMRIEIPDEHGRLHNILDEPKWMDTVWIPRNGGRVVFRSRFADYTGRWVHHCHVLLHEDHGMMQTVRSVDTAEDCTYNPRARVASHAMTGDEVSAIYPPPSLDIMYRQNMHFVDPSPFSGHTYPGFDVPVPALEPRTP